MDYLDFRRKIVADRNFAEGFRGCMTPAALIEAAANAGFIFTEDDMRNNTELLPEELEAASGGNWVPVDSWILCRSCEEAADR